MNITEFWVWLWPLPWASAGGGNGHFSPPRNWD